MLLKIDQKNLTKILKKTKTLCLMYVILFVDGLFFLGVVCSQHSLTNFFICCVVHHPGLFNRIKQGLDVHPVHALKYASRPAGGLTTSRPRQTFEGHRQLRQSIGSEVLQESDHEDDRASRS